METCAFSNRIVLVERCVQPGERVEAGAMLARVITNPADVANYELAADLRKQIERAEAQQDAAGAERYRAMLALAPQEAAVEEVKAGQAGWVVGLTHTAPGSAIPPGEAVARVATDNAVLLETKLAPDRMPTINTGGTSRVLLLSWSSSQFDVTINDMRISAEFSLAKAKFTPEELAILGALPNDACVELNERMYPVTATISEEEVLFTVHFENTPSPERYKCKTGQSVSTHLSVLPDHKLASKWSSISLELVLKAPKASLSTQMNQALLIHLKQGEYEAPVDDIWVETGKSRLFTRLFSK